MQVSKLQLKFSLCDSSHFNSVAALKTHERKLIDTHLQTIYVLARIFNCMEIFRVQQFVMSEIECNFIKIFTKFPRSQII